MKRTNILEPVRLRSLARFRLLELATALLEFRKPYETDGRLLERVLHGIILSNETRVGRAGLLCVADELLLLPFVLFFHLFALLREHILTKTFCLALRHDCSEQIRWWRVSVDAEVGSAIVQKRERNAYR